MDRIKKVSWTNNVYTLVSPKWFRNESRCRPLTGGVGLHFGGEMRRELLIVNKQFVKRVACVYRDSAISPQLVFLFVVFIC